MIVPAAMNIESAAEILISSLHDQVRESQQKELSSFGDERAKSLGATGLSNDFRKGFELGIETARAVLAGSALLAINHINAKDIL